MQKSSVKSFISLIKDIDQEKREQRDRGTLFELLVKTYLKNEPMYRRLFDEVWLLNEVPTEYNIPKVDTGVDLVGRKAKTGELIAIQCKYYSKDTTIQKVHIDSFLNEVGKNYYSEGLIIATTDKWSKNAEEALLNRNKTIMRISLNQLKDSQIDWSEFNFTTPEKVVLQDKKTPRKHQIPAINTVIDAFENADRGKLIMAPGTGKTYTSMVIAEKMAEKKEGTFKVLYLVPSIQLLSQTLREWNADIKCNMDSIAVCSDRKVTKNRIGTEIEDIATADIGFPATTNYTTLLDYQNIIETRSSKSEFISVFSTYQSIDVISEAQENGFYDFDLIICDEAHRTTGTTESNQEASAFTKVHSNKNIRANKRLYQTATPRVYGEDAKKKAQEKSIVIADMNNPQIYGEELHRIGFGDAIRKGILTDYKVMVLAVDEDIIARRFQDMFASNEAGLQFDDVTKIIGCWNGLVKRDGQTNKTLGQAMKRAIAFTGTINDSKNITNMFSKVVDEYLYKDTNINSSFKIDIQHADGTMNAIEKNEKIDWLKSEIPENTCRVLSNARFLTEGVDVPELDAVMFLKPRKSKIDIAQAVGRVMRKSEGKDYGYIILPIGVPAGSEPHSILDNNERYAVVWEILNALRSIDERFEAMINKLELNKNKPNKVNIIGVGDAPTNGELETPKNFEEQLALDLSEESLTDLEKAIYGKIVQKVGNVRYWDQWSDDVAKIAQQHINRITIMLENQQSDIYIEFQKFMKSIRYNINDSITEHQAIEMLAQHLITKPVFEALFETYSFVNNNPVSQSMESILEVLNKQGLVKEQQGLEDFYDSVRARAEGIDNLEAKQKIIIQLYNKFFKTGFKETTERLGIVFTPVELVDFIIQSVNDVLKRHFDQNLTNENVHILDPFTGTGTFIVRLLQSGIISKEDLLRKYTNEIHANEIVLLSYYIAAINIEETYHELMKDEQSDYEPFKGIVLTDTFESSENENTFNDEFFGINDKRLKKQQEASITAIIGNPPYSIGNNNANLDNNNANYPQLNQAIKDSYVKHSKASAKNTLFDSYIKAIRWSTDRIQGKGVIGFVTNGSFIDSRGADGLRKSLLEDFNYVYVYNLRGDQRTVGEKSRQEGGKIFGSGSRTPVAITILVKDGSEDHKLLYNDIGDYLSTEEKLKIIDDNRSLGNVGWEEIIPDKNNDWINQRDEKYDIFSEMDGDVFTNRAIGVGTKRDPWVYGFSKSNVIKTAKLLSDNFNSEVEKLQGNVEGLNRSGDFIKWSSRLLTRFKSMRKIEFDNSKLIVSMYRPFTKKYLLYQDELVDRPGPFRYIFGEENEIIYVTRGAKVGSFSSLLVNEIPAEVMLGGSGTGFARKNNNENDSLFEVDEHNNVKDSFVKSTGLSKQDIIYYVYALLHSQEYQKRYESDLSKGLPRIPNLENKDKFIEIGKKLSYLHLNYEDIPPYQNLKIEIESESPSYRVQKMKHPRRWDHETIIFNDDITIRNIPEKAYDYIINGRSAISWIMDQYRVKTDKSSGIIDDPNQYSTDKKYIFNLLLSIINVSVQTVELISEIPKLEIKD